MAGRRIEPARRVGAESLMRTARPHRLFTQPAAVSKVVAEASGFLVVPLVFKTSGRRAAPSAGSIPVRFRELPRRCWRGSQDA
jgi:hypothetical protein